jgi:hypothetical protein
MCWSALQALWPNRKNGGKASGQIDHEAMMVRLSLSAVAVLALVACAPQVPDSARGVGFESYSDYMKRRDGELAGRQGAVVPGPAISPERPGAGAQALGPSTPLTAIPDLDPNRPRADTVAGVQTQSGEMARVSGTAISDEQDFDAVAARETIQSDAERRRQQQQQYVVVEPTALPQRSGSGGPNIVSFAISTQHNPGVKMYARSAIRLRSLESACGGFTSADLAQEEFLRRGGPERDPMGVDPDGDGFACGWDPRPFRLVKQ